MVNLFERLGKRPPPAEKKTERSNELEHAQKLLDFLQRWAKNTVSVRDICVFAPRSLRDRKTAIDAAEILVKHGWLMPLASHRHDRREWQIVRKPLIPATVAPAATVTGVGQL